PYPPARSSSAPLASTDGRYRPVVITPRTRTVSHLVGRTRPRIVGILVGRDVEDVGIALEAVLRPVAMVEVPVDDRHALDAVALEPGRRDRHVVEEAEAHGAIALGMVPGRAHEREAVLHLPCQHRLADDEEAPGRDPRGI